MFRESLVKIAVLFVFVPTFSAQDKVPDWCRDLPRAEYKSLKRIPSNDPWFEVYEVAPQTFAIYEPHQFEEAISYLILGHDRAVLFDTGMGIGDMKKVVSHLTPLPIIVLNSHTHNDHVGDNWQFDTIYSMDTEFTRKNAKGSRENAQAELQPGSLCGDLPKGFNTAKYAVRPWKIKKYIHEGDKIDLGGRTIEILSTPGHTPDAMALLDRANRLLFTGDTYYAGPIWLFRPETDLKAYAASIRRLAALAPSIDHVLGQHNEPLSAPSVLPELVKAFGRLRSGEIPGQPTGDGKATYQVGAFSFILSAEKTSK